MKEILLVLSELECYPGFTKAESRPFCWTNMFKDCIRVEACATTEQNKPTKDGHITWAEESFMNFHLEIYRVIFEEPFIYV